MIPQDLSHRGLNGGGRLNGNSGLNGRGSALNRGSSGDFDRGYNDFFVTHLVTSICLCLPRFEQPTTQSSRFLDL
jgi:hypothetical protein